MNYLVILFLMSLAVAALLLYIVINDIRELRRFGELKGYTRFIVAGILCIIFICYNPPHLKDTLDLNDSQIVTGVLEYKDGNFILTGSGDDYPDWDFSWCNDDSMVKLHCNGKEITVWHNNHVVYQVEKNGKILYGITRNNIGVICFNLMYILMYIMIFAFIVDVVTNFNLRLNKLLEDEKRNKFENRFVTEEELIPVKRVPEPKAPQQMIRNIPRTNTATVQTTPKQSPNIRPTISNNAFYTSSDSGKILRRFCKHCGTELGKTEEIRNHHDALIDIVYNQYKFCPNCGMDSDPNMLIKAKDNNEWKVSIGLTVLSAPIWIIIITSENTTMLLIILGIILIVIFLSRNIHKCPSCGTLYEKEHFCTNCGRDLK